MIKSHYKKEPDKELVESMRGIKWLAFRLLRESQDVRIKYFWNGYESDSDPLGSCLNDIISHAMEAAFYTRDATQLSERQERAKEIMMRYYTDRLQYSVERV